MPLASYVLSLCLHIGIILIIWLWPASKPLVYPEQPVMISLVDGAPGGNKEPSPILGPMGAKADGESAPAPAAKKAEVAQQEREETRAAPIKAPKDERPMKKEEPKTVKKEIAKKETIKKETVKKEPAKKTFIKEEAVKEAAPSVKKEADLAKVESQTIEACEKFIYDVLKAMDMTDVKVTSVVDEEGALSIDMEGSNMGILIGKRGQTLDSLQYLTNRVANKMQEGYVRVKLDTEDYRRRRKETLENLAKNIASKVKRTRRTVSLEPMNPYERRIIHSALQGDPAVSTHSEGEEPYRRVVVTLVRK